MTALGRGRPAQPLENSPSRRHLRHWLDRHGMTMTALEKRAELSRGSLSTLMRGRNNLGRRMYARLMPLVNWPAEVAEEVEQNIRLARIRRGRCADPAVSAIPWPESVERLKADPPIYSKPWTRTDPRNPLAAANEQARPSCGPQRGALLAGGRHDPGGTS